MPLQGLAAQECWNLTWQQEACDWATSKNAVVRTACRPHKFPVGDSMGLWSSVSVTILVFNGEMLGQRRETNETSSNLMLLTFEPPSAVDLRQIYHANAAPRVKDWNTPLQRARRR